MIKDPKLAAAMLAKKVNPFLLDFIRESNAIEGIFEAPNNAQLRAYVKFIDQPSLTIPDVEEFVHAIQPNAVLRERPGLNVRVGPHIPPAGGPEMRIDLQTILEQANVAKSTARDLGLRTPRRDMYEVHLAYETLHPYTDGNGRSGRAIYYWMNDPYHERLFLHDWYYMSLQFGHGGRR